MRRAFPFALAVVLASCAACTEPAQAPHTDLAEGLARKTVALVAGDHAFCSGVWTSGDSFVTANHCVDDVSLGERIAYVAWGDLSRDDGDEVEAARWGRLDARDASHDLALVRVRLAPSHDVAELAAGAVPGEDAFTMGHPLGMWYSYSAGSVAAVRYAATSDLDVMRWVQTTAPIAPGCSGGGVFNARGELLGIAHAYFPGAEALNLYVHVTYVRALLGEVAQ